MPDDELCVLAPLRVEAAAARRGARRADVHRTGMGRRRSEHAARRLAARLAWHEPVAIVGVCGAIDPNLRPGDVVVASELRSSDGTVRLPLPAAPLLAREVAALGLPVHCGPLVTSERLATGTTRTDLAADGAVAVDMESAWLAAGVSTDERPRPLAVVRIVLDTPSHRLASPGTLRRLRLARRRISSVMPAVERWGQVTGPRQVLLASPRSFCAGVERAIEIVERALDRFRPPVYVRRQIVHNTHVVRGLEARGAVFVHEVDDVPPGSVVVLAAHGVAPEVREAAERRDLTVIDATCPLVAKVHSEARRFVARDYDVVLIGHEGHEEVEGTVGEAPDRITLVGSIDEIDRLHVRDPERVAYLTQTTLAVDEAATIVDHLRSRYPSLVGPRSEDICYATQNRQEAVAAVAPDVDLMLVVGSQNSSNSLRLAEVAARSGATAHLVDGCEDIALEWLDGVAAVGITAGASAPEWKVREVVAAIGGLGPIAVEERIEHVESVAFALPAEVRP